MSYIIATAKRTRAWPICRSVVSDIVLPMLGGAVSTYIVVAFL